MNNKPKQASIYDLQIYSLLNPLLFIFTHTYLFAFMRSKKSQSYFAGVCIKAQIIKLV